MRTISTNSEVASITSFLIAIPFVTIFLLFKLGYEPNLGSLPSLLNINVSRLGSLIFFGATALLLVAFIVSSMPIARNIQTGKGIAADPINLLLAVATLLMIIAVVGGIIIDQYPCWIGVLNCD